MLEHGGRLREAAAQQGIPVDQWLDLSTGISPFAWPVPEIPRRAWQRLPEDDDGLEAAARACYGAGDLLPVAGAQAAIQALPKLRAPSRVGVIQPGYAEHAHAWRQAGHEVHALPVVSLLQQVDAFDVIVLIHPNNPGGECFTPDGLLTLRAQLAERGGWLVVDEAFMDATPDDSLCPASGAPGLVVLRSLGKFYGLAGARAGFVCAWPELLGALRERLGPWTVTGPTRYVVARALADADWQAAQRARLHDASTRLHVLLQRHDLRPDAGTAFFQWCRTPEAAALQAALAERAILVRRFEEPASLRFGLPATEAERQRLAAALQEIRS